MLLTRSCVAGCSSTSKPVMSLDSVTDIPRWVDVMHHLLIALREFWKPTIPLIGEAASLLTVCYKDLEKNLFCASYGKCPSLENCPTLWCCVC